MATTMKIPDLGQNPLSIKINNDEYAYYIGEQVTVPDEVAELINNIEASKPTSLNDTGNLILYLRDAGGLLNSIFYDPEGKRVVPTSKLINYLKTKKVVFYYNNLYHNTYAWAEDETIGLNDVDTKTIECQVGIITADMSTGTLSIVGAYSDEIIPL